MPCYLHQFEVNLHWEVLVWEDSENTLLFVELASRTSYTTGHAESFESRKNGKGTLNIIKTPLELLVLQA